jgi:hypothetical protein
MSASISDDLPTRPAFGRAKKTGRSRKTGRKRTGVGDARGEELGDSAEEEVVEVGEGRETGVALRETKSATAEDEVLQLLEELQTGTNRVSTLLRRRV